ncbi:hypothetical protein N7462_009693 [Penicillium macrosclerotiorum]|uniref:uncharacterized protein n=1 Tax=Penicillium macrosclerotiorum TaxID=303699 RepID=UPI0025483439|nr:uncharacterized protein N7462_009693 [Penicillium macrosclerotiorum]KAJ5674254.1 hypothetical protein N7462_009693 [Penicillium macrosclerotiorum]
MPPLKIPFPCTEPKTEIARAKVLERIPLSEQRYHGEFIQPLVQAALRDIKSKYCAAGRPWCLPRQVIDENLKLKRSSEDGIGHDPPKKRHYESLVDSKLNVHSHEAFGSESSENSAFSQLGPPVILSTTSVNSFDTPADIQGIVKNPSSDAAVLAIQTTRHGKRPNEPAEYVIPPKSTFVCCTLPLSQPSARYPSEVMALDHPIPSIPASQTFNLILFDSPWPNKSVRRSCHYQVVNEMEVLTQRLLDILRVHSYRRTNDNIAWNPDMAATSSRSFHSQESLAAIWVTNSEKSRRAAYEALMRSGFEIYEEWIWIKITVDGEPVSPLDGLWRKPYEILIIGRRNKSTMDSASSHNLNPGPISQETDLLGLDPASIRRRVIAAVPDLHSRKPNLKSLFEQLFFKTDGPFGPKSVHQPYSALEVFARNLTAEWWACGNEVLKFNAREYWVDYCETN